ncbi:hypothetical protein AC1031_004337 [Aphanomyces cochlioides]|nr:hypothetical protein AC1031_004337 [Aphanomyces cochlioides]
MAKCQFDGCPHAPEAGKLKCTMHRNRTQCSMQNCRSQAYSKGLCVRHGTRKTCRMDGCQHYRRAGGYCARHTTEMRNSHAVKQEVAAASKNEPEMPQCQDIHQMWLDCPAVPSIQQDDARDDDFDLTMWDWAELTELLYKSNVVDTPKHMICMSF